MTDVIIGIVAVVFTFSFAIFVHELGHFVFAKLFRVHVETFSIGFWKKIWKRKWGETEYAISLIPFGGYVKLTGMHSKELEKLLSAEADESKKASEPQVPEAAMIGQPPLPDADDVSIAQSASAETMSESVVEEMRALRDKNYFQKVLVFSAGCVNNFLTAVIIYFLMLWIGHMNIEVPKPVIDEVRESAASLQLPIQSGDEIVSVAGKSVESYDEFLIEFENHSKKALKPMVAVGIVRQGTTTTVELPANPGAGLLKEGEYIAKVGTAKAGSAKAAAEAVHKLPRDQKSVEVTVASGGKDVRTMTVPVYAAAGPYWTEIVFDPMGPPYIVGPVPNLPAEKAGFKSGDQIEAVNGQPIKTRAEATRLIQTLVGKEIPMLVKRGDKTVTLNVEVRPDPQNPTRGQIGIIWGWPRTKLLKMPFGEAWKEAFNRAWAIAVFYPKAVGNLLTSNLQTIRENVGGPIAIGTFAYKEAQKTAVDFFELFALFNIILAITNLVPLPVFDGGHILFATIEAITRRPIPAKILVRIYNVFIFLIIGLALLITLNDVFMNFWRLL